MDLREMHVYEARIAQAADRPNEMVEAVKKLHLLHENLTAEERNLFWIAYQSKVGALHVTWRRVSSFGENETAIEKVNLIKNYKSNLRNEIIDVFFEMTEFTDEHILPYVSTQGSRYCYCKWKGDCYRFLGSVMTGTSKRIFYEKSLAEYTAAFNAIKIELPPQNEIRLGAALKISEGWHVMLNNVLKAYEVARVAYYDALNAYDCLEEANKNPLMVSLSKNLAKWQSEMQENGQFQSETSQTSNKKSLDHEPRASASNPALDNEPRASASNSDHNNYALHVSANNPTMDYEPRASTN